MTAHRLDDVDDASECAFSWLTLAGFVTAPAFLRGSFFTTPPSPRRRARVVLPVLDEARSCSGDLMEKAPRKSPKVRELGVAALFVSLCSWILYATTVADTRRKERERSGSTDIARDDGECVGALAGAFPETQEDLAAWATM